MIVYGRNAVREALRGKRPPSAVWVGKGAAGEQWLRGVDVTHAAPEEMDGLCGSAEHQGVCAEVGSYPYADPNPARAGRDGLVIALDEVQDPHNLGAVCRVAESAGASAVVIPERRSAEVTPAVCKASAGAVEHLDIARVGNLANWLGEAKKAGAWVYGAANSPEAVPYAAPDYRGGVVLVLGSEGRGLRPRVTGACDQLVRLPQRGKVDSLNVATAAAALVYGILHFRDVPLDRGT